MKEFEMSTDITSEFQHAIQEGNAALRVGDMFEARQHFRRATELEPRNVAAWLGLASAVPTFAEKRECFEHVLALDPQNEDARLGLAYVERKQADGEIVARTERGASGTAQTTPTPQAYNFDALTPVKPNTSVAVEYCYRHPDRETGLHCSICARPICGQCAIQGPVGQICPECARARRPRNYTVSFGDLVIAFPVALIVSALIGVGIGLFVSGFLLFFMFFVGPAIAELIVRAVERTTKMKRGRQMQVAVSIAIVLGTLLAFMFTHNLLPLLLYGFLAVSTAIARLR